MCFSFALNTCSKENKSMAKIQSRTTLSNCSLSTQRGRNRQYPNFVSMYGSPFWKRFEAEWALICLLVKKLRKLIPRGSLYLKGKNKLHWTFLHRNASGIRLCVSRSSVCKFLNWWRLRNIDGIKLWPYGHSFSSNMLIQLPRLW